MDAQDIRNLEPLLDSFVAQFTDCFRGPEVEALSLANMRVPTVSGLLTKRVPSRRVTSLLEFNGNTAEQSASKKTPRILAGSPKAVSIKHFVDHSPELKQQAWTRWHVKDTQKGPKVVECKSTIVYPQDERGLPGTALTLLVVRDILTGETKYFFCHAPKGTSVGVLLKVAFARWSVERCFEDDKNYIGIDHYEGRCYPGFMRHMLLSAVALLFISQARQNLLIKYPELTISQVRQATSALVESWWLPQISPSTIIDEAAYRIEYYQRRNAQARKSHPKTRLAKLAADGIDIPTIQHSNRDSG